MALSVLVLDAAGGQVPLETEIATVLQRRLLVEGEILGSRRRLTVLGPYYRAAIRFRKDDGSESEWKGLFDVLHPEHAMELFDRFQPGARVAIPASDRIALRPPRNLSRFPVAAALAIFMALFFLLPTLYLLFGIRNWWTHPLRLFGLAGLAAMTAALLIGYRTYRGLTTYQPVEARMVAAEPLAELERYPTEVTVNDAMRGYFSRNKYYLLHYTIAKRRYQMPDNQRSDSAEVPTPCTVGESCQMLYNPRDPWDLLVARPMNAESFAAPLALGGFGLVFLLLGLFVSM